LRIEAWLLFILGRAKYNYDKNNEKYTSITTKKGIEL
jgi:hypothetical protein